MCVSHPLKGKRFASPTTSTYTFSLKVTKVLKATGIGPYQEQDNQYILISIFKVITGAVRNYDQSYAVYWPIYMVLNNSS